MLDKELKKRLLEHLDWSEAAALREVVIDGHPTQIPHSNPPLRWKRTLKAAKVALDNLTILAATLPEEKRSQLFNEQAMASLFDAVLGHTLQRYIFEKKELIMARYQPRIEAASSVNENRRLSAQQYEEMVKVDKNPNIGPVLNPRRTRIAAKVAEQCLKYCYEQYEKIEPDGAFSSLPQDHIEKSIALVKGIETKISKMPNSAR
jgi:hypothetical protein